MADASEVLSAFRAELVDAGLVRRPSEAGDLPPMHISPINGPPAPGEREGIEDDPALVLSLLYSSDVAPARGPTSASILTIVVDVRFRARTNEARRRGMALAAAITQHLISPDTNYGFGFTMGGLEVLEVAPQGGGPVSPITAGDTGFDDVSKWLVEAPR